MEIGRVFVESVIVGKRHRALDETRVEALAESMDAIGLQQPISVYLGDEDNVHLIAGLHRLEAARKLKWEQVDASIVKLSPVRREMWEIAENLFRVDLTKEQRDEHIRRYAELIEAAEAEVSPQNAAQPKSGPKGGRPKSVARRIADETGLSDDTIRRALNPAPAAHVKPVVFPLDDEGATVRQVAALMAAWNKAGPEARREFLEQIDVPVFDRSAA